MCIVLPGGERLRRQRSVAQYRAIDLGIFALLLALFEFILCKAGTVWYSREAYVISLTPLFTAVVMMRWGVWGAIHAVLGGALWVFFYGTGLGAGWEHYLIYGLGNLGGLAGLLMLKKPGWQRVREKPLLTLAYGAAVTLGAYTGRALIALILGAPPKTLILYYTPEVITLLFTLVALWIVRRLDGLFENQHHYLKRIHQEMQSEEEGRSE